MKKFYTSIIMLEGIEYILTIVDSKILYDGYYCSTYLQYLEDDWNKPVCLMNANVNLKEFQVRATNTTDFNELIKLIPNLKWTIRSSVGILPEPAA